MLPMKGNAVTQCILFVQPFNFTGEVDPIHAFGAFCVADSADFEIHGFRKFIEIAEVAYFDCVKEMSTLCQFRRGVRGPVAGRRGYSSQLPIHALSRPQPATSPALDAVLVSVGHPRSAPSREATAPLPSHTCQHVPTLSSHMPYPERLAVLLSQESHTRAGDFPGRLKRHRVLRHLHRRFS